MESLLPPFFLYSTLFKNIRFDFSYKLERATKKKELRLL